MKTIHTTVFKRGSGLANKYPCHVCGEKMRVAFEQTDPFSDDKRLLLACNNCYKVTWVKKSTFDNFIKEDRVL